MNYDRCISRMDNGPKPYIANVGQMAMQNTNFRTAIWTGTYMQMTLMCIPPCGEIGLEMHDDVDQFIRIEQGRAIVKIGDCRQQGFCQCIGRGDVVFVPAGTWHNVINAGRGPLKVSSTYSPPNHPWGTIHRTKDEAEKEE
ncbi:cupin domain-containing protein [Konateibacter massiliensis]|uniref:cupin domain-containing protein n=1 Tax=Konateibacter massiliensis TaxID=2002841 RepID=UPI000C14A352|nr:cupin domain-containing protein [Konateibacter massiliensis]